MMEPAIDFVQNIGWAATFVSLIAIQFKSRTHVISFMIASCALWVIHLIGLHAWTGAVFNVLAFLRGLVALLPDTVLRRKLVLLFIPLIWVVAVVTWSLDGHTEFALMNLLPPLAMTLTTVGQASSQVFMLRATVASGAPLWFLYAALAGSQGGMVTEAVNIASSLLAIYRFHLRPWLQLRQAPQT